MARTDESGGVREGRLGRTPKKRRQEQEELKGTVVAFMQRHKAQLCTGIKVPGNEEFKSTTQEYVAMV